MIHLDPVLLVQREGTRADVAIHGTLMGADARAVRRSLTSLINAGVTTVDVDLSDVREADASGVAALIVAAKRLRARRGDLRVTGKSPPCRQTIERLHVRL